MRVVFITSEKLPVPPVKGGAIETWIHQVAMRLQNHAVTCLCCYEPELTGKQDQVNYKLLTYKQGFFAKLFMVSYKLPFKKSTSLLYYFPYSLWCAVQAKKLKAEIIHIHSRPQFVPIIRLFNRNAQIILHIHNVSVIGDKRNLWNENLFNKVDMIATCSQYLKNETIKRYPYLKNKTRVIYNGVDTDIFSTKNLDFKNVGKIKTKFNITDENIVLLYTGRLKEYKGVHLLIEAFKELLSKFPKAKLLIVGGTTYSNNKETDYVKSLKSASENLQDKIIFTGYIDHHNIPKWINLSDIYVVPSTWEEPFGVVNIEAMAMRKPVVAFAKGGIKEIITHNVDGILINDPSAANLAQELHKIMKDPSLRARLGKNAMNMVVNKFSWERIVEDLNGVYSNLTSKTILASAANINDHQRKIKVSVIIPVFNSEEFLAQTLESVLNQSYQDYEIVIIDDGSTDQSIKIIKEYQFKNPNKIHYFYQDNSGPSVARNRGIKEAKGEFIAFLDADDLWLPSRLQEGVKVLDSNPDVALTHANTVRINAAGNPALTPKKKKDGLSGHVFQNLLLRKIHISCVTVLLRRKVIEDVGDFDEKMSLLGAEDRDLWLRITQKYQVMFIDKVLAKYRLRTDGLSKKSDKMVEGRIHSIDKFCPAGSSSQGKLRRLALAQVYKEYGDSLLMSQRFEESKRQYRKALSFAPFSIWPWVNLIKASFKLKMR